MKWDTDAEETVGRIPFFVRGRVRKKVEEEARGLGAATVTMAHVRGCQQRFMKNQEREVRGYSVETCFGTGGCSNRIDMDDDLAKRLESLLAGHGLREFMQCKVNGPLKMHHEFRVTIADCPNACSRPQIVDIGLIAASIPQATTEPCVSCGACVAACQEGAISLDTPQPTIDRLGCLGCGRCPTVCPSSTIVEERKGYRILLGGKLGRHPQLGRKLAGIYAPEETLSIVEKCLALFKKENRSGERFGEILNRTGLDFLPSLDWFKSS